ncbi:MAG: DUF2062 domain-containing protein [Gammaproteobacteria bacterium]|nr:DUF2062 domain-containing protein [Gammaproteobacteria bacterium]
MKLRNHKLMRLILELLRQGITPHKIALCIALGVVLGVTPVIGSTTILCAAAAVAFGINLPLIQVVNYLVYPLQLLLLIPFIQAGQWLFHQPPLPFSLAQLTSLFRMSFWHTLGMLWEYTLHGLVAWLILGGMAALIIYLASRPILGFMLVRIADAEK